MKKLLTILILILLSSCSKDSLMAEEDCNCILKTEEVKVVNNGGVFTTRLITTTQNYDSNDCDLDGYIVFQSNNTTKTVKCN